MAPGTKGAQERTARQLLEVLVCPVTRETLEFQAAAGELISRGAGLAYPVRDGIPILLVDEARELEDDAPPSLESDS